MPRLEALLGLLGGAAVVVRRRWDGRHVAAAACFESKGNRRHFDCAVGEMLGLVVCKCGTKKLLSIDSPH